MRYGYKYHDREGVVKSGEIEAKDREAAFTSLARQGVKPMQFWVVEKPTGKREVRYLVAGLSLLVAALLLLVFHSRREEGSSLSSSAGVTTNDEWTQSVGLAYPRSRHQLLHGGEIGELATNLAFFAERVLANFAEPGVKGPKLDARAAALFAEDLPAALNTPLRINGGDSNEVVELKRVVSGMKEEISMRLNGGEDPGRILQWLMFRQDMEVQHFNEVKRRVREGVMSKDLANKNLLSMGFPAL